MPSSTSTKEVNALCRPASWVDVPLSDPVRVYDVYLIHFAIKTSPRDCPPPTPTPNKQTDKHTHINSSVFVRLITDRTFFPWYRIFIDRLSPVGIYQRKNQCPNYVSFVFSFIIKHTQMLLAKHPSSVSAVVLCQMSLCCCNCRNTMEPLFDWKYVALK